MVKVPAGGGPQVTVATVTDPRGIAVDRAGNIFIAPAGQNQVLEILAAGGTHMVASGLGGLETLAVDPAGNLFIADQFNNRVVEVPIGGAPQITVASGLFVPRGLAVDGADNIFIADLTSSLVFEVPAGGGLESTVGTGLLYPFGVAVNAADDVFIADTSNNRVVEVQRSSVTFGSVNIGSGVTLTLNYNINAYATLGNPQVLTQGAPNLDFTLAGGCNCNGSVVVGSTCTANVTFTPKFAGARSGAAQIVDASGNVLATTFIHGIGQGSQIAFGPGVQSTGTR